VGNNKRIMIHIYSIVRNDAYLLPYFIRHYSTFADKIFIIDDHSTDNTKEIANSFPNVEVLDYEYNNGFNEDSFSQSLIDHYKKHSRGKADWVMCADSDEFIYHKDMKKVLKEQRDKGHRVMETLGYMMVSKELPSRGGQIYDEIKEGLIMPQYGKTVIFDPELNVTFGHGRHKTSIKELVTSGDVGIKLLHYRYLSKEFFIARSEHLYERAGYDKKTCDYRMKRGLKWYEDALKSKLLKNVI